MKASLNYKNIDPQFKLNGACYDTEGLKEVAYSFIKEGVAHEKAIGNFLSDWLDENTTIEVQTSGSTGKPKKILLQKQHMVNSALATGDYFNLKPANTALLCLSTAYIAGKMMLVRAMVLGLHIDYLAPSSSPLQQVQKNYDFCAMVPLQVENSLDKLEQIRTIIVGGAPMPVALKKKIRHKSTEIYETYGMTETITHVAVNRVNAKKTISSSGVENSFTALPNVRFQKDERDCLVITAPKVSEKEVITNDVVNLISATEFEWLGRYDNVINSGGVKLFPEQIEAKLAAHINKRFFVAGLPDEKLGQQLILVTEDESDPQELLQRLKQASGLERFELPKKVFVIPKFIETDSGKIRRKENLRLIKT